jgi:ABC-type antimicrobial peptide transport system permease subunit
MSLFAALLTMSFISVSLDLKKKDIGILRALGAGKRDIAVICLSESLLIALINFAVSLIGIIAICIALNAVIGFSLFFMGFLPIAMLLLLCTGVTALATILPVLKITRRKPVDIINNK